MIAKELALSIKNDYATGAFTMSALARRYNKSTSTIRLIIHGLVGFVPQHEMTGGELRKQAKAAELGNLRREYKLKGAYIVRRRKPIAIPASPKTLRTYKCGPDRKPATLTYFQSLLTPQGDCLLYTNPAKIPRIRWEGQQLPAARIAAALHNLIPYSELHTTNYKINSTCHNLRCCNPDHLRPQRVYPTRTIRKSRRSKFILEHWQEEKP